MSGGRRQSVKLVDGPMAGRIFDLPASVEALVIGGFWRYVYAGKDAGQVLFAREGKSRASRRFALAYIRRFGKHPAVEMSLAKGTPFSYGGRTERRVARRKRVGERKMARRA